jgi:hypothetical protein
VLVLVLVAGAGCWCWLLVLGAAQAAVILRSEATKDLLLLATADPSLRSG